MDLPSFSFYDGTVQWWQTTLIGIIILLSGIVAFFWASVFIDILILAFGILAFVVGGIMIVFYFSTNEGPGYRYPILFAGTLSLLIGLMAFLFPGIIQTTFIIIIAFLAIINSTLLILVGCSLPDKWKTRLVIVLFGMLALFLSILMVLFPSLSALILVSIWGIYACVIGALCIAIGISMRGMAGACPACSPEKTKP
jgi:uncharacterized membrane protein HdeD (DUF308 family)